MLLYLAGRVSTPFDGMLEATESILSGHAYSYLCRYADFTQSIEVKE